MYIELLTCIPFHLRLDLVCGVRSGSEQFAYTCISDFFKNKIGIYDTLANELARCHFSFSEAMSR